MQLRRNDPAALPAFARLNLNRIEELHIVEDSDRAMGEDPSLYIAPGNYMLSLHAGETVAGVVALKRDGDGAYELTKLAVEAACHRLGRTQFWTASIRNIHAVIWDLRKHYDRFSKPRPGPAPLRMGEAERRFLLRLP